MIEVPCIGGPCHGQTIGVGKYQQRFSVHMKNIIERNPFHLPKSVPIYKSITTCTYYLTKWYEKAHSPERWRSVFVAVYEGEEVSWEEKREIQRLCETKPWEFPEVSIIDQFDEWFAQQALKHFGIEEYYP